MDDSPHQTLAAMFTRRSTSAIDDVGPTDDELDAILAAAVTVPDHGGLRPWRLVVVRGHSRRAFGAALGEAGRVARPDRGPQLEERLREKALAAPVLIAVAARIDARSPVPVWEQVASAACTGYAISLAAHQLGLGAIWKSTPFPPGPALRQLLDMGAEDQFLGWINLGRRRGGTAVQARPSADLAPVVRVVSEDGRPLPYVRTSQETTPAAHPTGPAEHRGTSILVRAINGSRRRRSGRLDG